MGLRFKKSIKLGKGVKLNLGKKSAGISFGGKGHSTSINSKGRMTNTIGIPGTGLSYTSTVGGKKSKKGSSKSSTTKKKTQQKEAEPTWLEAFVGLVDLLPEAKNPPKEYVPKEHSSKTYRTSGLALQIISPILFVLSLLLSLVFPFALILVALSIFLFVLGRKYKAKGKETEQTALPGKIEEE